jgi:tetratricopeptide (TPR) repeat protein
METVKSYWRVALVSTLAVAAVATTYYVATQRSVPKQSRKKTIITKTDVDRTKLAKQAKTDGNSYFTSKEYQKALEKYTEAIEMMPEAVYYANRAACHLALVSDRSLSHD